MNCDSEIDSLCADSENKYIIGDYNALYCNDGKQENKSKEYGNEKKVDQTNENGHQKLIETDCEKQDLIDVREANSSGIVDAVDGPSGELIEDCNEKSDNGITANGAKLVPDTVDKETLAIFQFSDSLAENILHEALLINDIHTRDKINVDNLTETEDLDRDLNIKKTLFPSDNGVISGREAGVGYDRYLIDKLLRSKADPEEIPDADGFDGIEEHFKRDKENTYPGLDSDDAYVRAGLDRPESDREPSDKNNNEMPPGIIEQFDDTVLQTIHEDAELVIDYANQVTEEIPIEKVADANKDEGKVANKDEGKDANKDDGKDANKDEGKVANKDEGEVIDEGVVEDVAPNTDENDDVQADDTNENIEPEKQTQPIPEEPTDTGTIQVVEDVEESEDEEEEADCCDMTHREKKIMVNAVRQGDIDKLEKLLEKKNANMNMIWYGENLLMVAIRSGKEAMCEFLIDNGIDWEHQTKLVEVDENGDISVHKMGARQMAYDLHLFDTVELLDCKSDNLFPFIVPKLREPRLREPIFPMCPPPLDEGIRQEVFMDQNELLKVHKLNLIEQAKIQAELLEEKLKAERSRKSVTTTGADDETFHTVKSKHSCSDDEISQVFGPDEGYETMSPDLSRSNRQDYNHVNEPPMSIRSTRACNLIKAHNTSKAHLLKRSESPDYPMYNNTLIESVGSYSFESRYWHMPKSAPQLRNYSMESLNDTSVRMGLPFVHGDTRKRLHSTPQSARQSLTQRRAASAHTNISPFSQVAKLLEQSKLFSPLDKSRATTPHLPAISSRKTSAGHTTHTKINYIYADRNSAKHSETFSERSDLLPRRKLKC